MAGYPHGYAVVVGIADYHWSVGPLSVSVLNDARDVADLLRDPDRCGYPEEQVKLLLNGEATHKRMLAALDWLVARTAAPEATAIVYFSGHGFRQRTRQGEFTYLAAQDARLDTHRTAGFVTAAELMGRLRAMKAHRLAVLLDCCHAAGAAEVKGRSPAAAYRQQWAFKGGLDDRLLTALGKGRGRAVVASCTAEEKSLVEPGRRNSLFTVHLREALAGAGTRAGKQEVGILDVFDHLAGTVPLSSGGRQHPVLKAEMSDNFALALKGQQQSAATPSKARRPRVPAGGRFYTAETIITSEGGTVILNQPVFGSGARRGTPAVKRQRPARGG